IMGAREPRIRDNFRSTQISRSPPAAVAGVIMQVSVENTGKLERRLTVSVPSEQYETQVRTRIDEMSRSMQLKGFRRGKVPRKVVEQRFGRDVRGEAFGQVLRESFSKAIAQENFRIAGNPSIETSGEPVDGQIVYTAVFEI